MKLSELQSRVWSDVCGIWADERTKELFVKSYQPICYLVTKKEILEEMRDIINDLIIDEMHKYPDQP